MGIDQAGKQCVTSAVDFFRARSDFQILAEGSDEAVFNRQIGSRKKLFAIEDADIADDERFDRGPSRRRRVLRVWQASRSQGESERNNRQEGKARRLVGRFVHGNSPKDPNSYVFGQARKLPLAIPLLIEQLRR